MIHAPGRSGEDERVPRASVALASEEIVAMLSVIDVQALRLLQSMVEERGKGWDCQVD